jgi:hypothetical protein
MAQVEGRIMLTLRSWTDSQPVDTNGASPSGIVGGAVAQRETAPAAASHPVVNRRGRGGKDKNMPPPPPTLTAEAPQTDRVEILRGDRFEKREFNRGDKR